MKSVENLVRIIYFYFINVIRSYKFIAIIAVGVFLGILCVPAGTAGYEVIYLGGVRGIYNSAWLGCLGALLPSILLWLPGFYWLRSQISEDKRLKVGDIIASAPISNLSYILGKVLANFFVLVALTLIFLAALAGMQFVRQEDTQFILLQFIQPFLFISIPYLFMSASLSVLFDVLPGIKGSLGNIIFFCIWIVLIGTSALAGKSKFDLFGIGTVLTEMMKGAKESYPEIRSDAGSLGFNTTNGVTPTFIWIGMTWKADFLASRLLWRGAALLFTYLSSLLFDRFIKMPVPPQPAIATNDRTVSLSGLDTENLLSPVMIRNFHIIKAAKGELNIMLSGCPVWWYLAALAGNILCLFTPFKPAGQWTPLTMLLPISIWAQMGCREKYYFTDELIQSSCSLHHKHIAEWLAGLGITLCISFGILLRLVMLAEWKHFAAWVTGAIFISTLSILLGCLGGSRRLFESVYITCFYLGPVCGTPFLDFWGMKTINTVLYLMLSCVLMIIITFYIWNKERQLFNIILKRRHHS